MAMAARNLEELPLVLRIEEMGEILGVSRATAYNLARSKDFPAAVRVGEKRIIVLRDKLIEWLHNKAGQPLE